MSLRTLPDNFQLEQLRACFPFMKGKNLAIDIGAHRGIWTKEMLEFFSNVIAIEPTFLHKKIDNKAVVINAACSDKKGFCSIESGIRNDGQSHVISGNSIQVITVDELNLKPDFIKIDVEGMEYNVLKGACGTIMRNRPVVMIEENELSLNYGHSVGRASKLLKKWGMKPLVTFHMYPEKDKNILFGW